MHAQTLPTPDIQPLTADPQHVDSGLIEFDEDAIVDLTQTEKLKHLADLGGDLVDTANTHYKCKFGFCRDIKISLLLGFSLQPKEKLIN